MSPPLPDPVAALPRSLAELPGALARRRGDVARLGAAGTTAAELEATVAAVSAALGVAPLAAR